MLRAVQPVRRPAPAARPAPRVSVALRTRPSRPAARSMATWAGSGGAAPPPSPIDTPVSKDAPKSTAKKLRHPLRELNKEDIGRLAHEPTELSKHFERQSRAEALETDIPTGVAERATRAGSKSAPGDLSLPEVEMRLRTFLRGQAQLKDTNAAAAERHRVQQLKVLQSMQRMVKFANDHHIDPATNRAFFDEFKKHLDFLGLSETTEPELIAREDSNWEDVHEVDPLRLQKLFYIYAKELSDLSGILPEGILDPQGVNVNPMHLPTFTAAEFSRTLEHFHRTGKLRISQRNETVEVDPVLANVAPPAVDKLAAGFVFRLAFLIRLLREHKVPGDEERVRFFVKATANMSDLTNSFLLSEPAIMEAELYPGVLPSDIYSRLITLCINIQNGPKALELFNACRKVHPRPEPAAWHGALMALSVNRAEQRKLLNEMDKLGLPASEPVFEAIIAGHLFARDVTSSYEALIAGRREGFKLHQAHSHHVAAMVQTGAVDPASVHAYIMEVAKEGVVIEYDLLDQLYAVLKREHLLTEASQLMELREQQHPDIPPPAELAKMSLDDRIVQDNIVRVAVQYARDGLPPPPMRRAPEPTSAPIKNLDKDMMELKMETAPELMLRSMTEVSPSEAQARREFPEWFGETPENVDAATQAAINDLPPDVASRIRKIIDTTPIDQLSDALRVAVLDELEAFKKATNMHSEIDAVRTALNRTPQEMNEEDPLARDDFVMTEDTKSDITEEQVAQLRAMLAVQRNAARLSSKARRDATASMQI